MQFLAKRVLSIQSALALCAIGLACVSGACVDPRQLLIGAFSPEYQAEGNPSTLTPVFNDGDSQRARIQIQFTEVASGMPMITDIQFPPGRHDAMFVAAKTGELYVTVPGQKAKPRLVAKFSVTTESEQGLLGVAFHPDFRTNGLMYFNYTVKKDGRDLSRVCERKFTNPLAPAARKGKLVSERILMEVEQPYQNHNAGQIAFGPDGMLYIGWGDGGWREDPKRHGQNPATLLGAMLRIDPRPPAAPGEAAYRIPPDNPFVNTKGYRPEIFAIGLRNPWRYSFDLRGRLIVADVGQDLLEEVAIVSAGENHGWDIREASACHRPKKDCAKTGARKETLIDPVYEYGREDGRSITGGYVYTGSRIRALKNRYVFGDFVSGRIWAISLPADGRAMIPKNKSHALGKWPVLLSTFGRDTRGEIYVADFGGGKVFRIDPAN
ncbi:MAG: PQQ-dependent sugar dehydrogenase [Leptospirales bacterium]|jgi:glucose/arabinose dehydrogenase